MFDKELDCIMGWCFHTTATCPIYEKFLVDRGDDSLSEDWSAQKQALKDLIAKEVIGESEWSEGDAREALDKGLSVTSGMIRCDIDLRVEQRKALGIVEDKKEERER